MIYLFIAFVALVLALLMSSTLTESSAAPTLRVLAAGDAYADGVAEYVLEIAQNAVAKRVSDLRSTRFVD